MQTLRDIGGKVEWSEDTITRLCASTAGMGNLRTDIFSLMHRTSIMTKFLIIFKIIKILIIFIFLNNF